MRKQQAKRASEMKCKPKTKAKNPGKGKKENPRIKKVGNTFWVLSKDNRLKKYRGFSNAKDAEQHAAVNPVNKTVKITAEKSPKQSAKAKNKATGGSRKKAYTSPSVRIVKLDSSKGDPKVQSFSDGKKKYGKK